MESLAMEAKKTVSQKSEVWQKIESVLRSSPYPLAVHEIPFERVGANQGTVARYLRWMAEAKPPLVESITKDRLRGVGRGYKLWYWAGSMTQSEAISRAETLVLFK